MKEKKIKIETLTPVHVGSGNSYTFLECYIDGKKLKRIKTSSLRLEEVEEDIIELGEIKNKGEFDKRFEKIQKVISEGKLRYDVRIDDEIKPYKEIRDRRKNIIGFRLTEIREQIKTADIPFIPASSVKGAIRAS